MPDWKPHIRSRLASLRLSPSRETEIVEELAQHLDDRWRELIAGGASEEEAASVALGQLRVDVLSAERTAISARRAEALASKRLATFAHAISSTAQTAPNSTYSKRRACPTTCSRSGMT